MPAISFPEPAQESKPVSQPGKKILLVDDDHFFHSVYRHSLQGAGFELMTATNGREALAKIINFHPDLTLLDILMPVMDGMCVLRELKHRGTTHGPVVMITGYQNVYEATQKEARLAGAAGFLTKPFTPSQLRAELQKHLSH